MRYFLKPIALRTPISFVCSMRFADIFADKAKKQRNIVIKIIMLKTLLSKFVIRVVVVVSPVPPMSIATKVPFAACVILVLNWRMISAGVSGFHARSICQIGMSSREISSIVARLGCDTRVLN